MAQTAREAQREQRLQAMSAERNALDDEMKESAYRVHAEMPTIPSGKVYRDNMHLTRGAAHGNAKYKHPVGRNRRDRFVFDAKSHGNANTVLGECIKAKHTRQRKIQSKRKSLGAQMREKEGVRVGISPSVHGCATRAIWRKRSAMI